MRPSPHTPLPTTFSPHQPLPSCPLTLPAPSSSHTYPYLSVEDKNKSIAIHWRGRFSLYSQLLGRSIKCCGLSFPQHPVNILTVWKTECGHHIFPSLLSQEPSLQPGSIRERGAKTIATVILCGAKPMLTRDLEGQFFEVLQQLLSRGYGLVVELALG